MPSFLVGAGGLIVAALVIADDLAGVLQIGLSAPAAEERRTTDVQGPADLLHRHERVFPPAGGPFGWPRTPAREGPGSSAASAPDSLAPRSASGRPPA